jgi:hypothetical protein
MLACAGVCWRMLTYISPWPSSASPLMSLPQQLGGAPTQLPPEPVEEEEEEEEMEKEGEGGGGGGRMGPARRLCLGL